MASQAAAPVDPGPGPAGHGVGQLGDAGLVGEHAGGRPHRLPGPDHGGQAYGLGVGQHHLDGLVEDRDGQAVQMGGDGHDHVTAA